MSQIDRRDFVKGAAGAAFGLAGMPPVVLGGMDDRKVRVGVIGTGLRGRSLLRLVLQRADTDVPAVCDVESDALQRAADMVSEARDYSAETYGNGEEAYLDLLARDDLDAVLIATP